MSMRWPPAAIRLAHHVASHAQLLALLLLAVLGTVASVNSPVQHSLLVTALSWLAVCLLTLARGGLSSSNLTLNPFNTPSPPSRPRTPSFLAGALLSLAHICDRAACDKDGIRATKWLLPLFVVAAAAVAAHLPAALPGLPSLAAHNDSPQTSRSLRLLLALTAAAAAALAVYVTPATAALGISSAIFAALGLVGFEAATRDTKNDGSGARGLVAADGSLTRRNSVGASHRVQQLAALRDVAVAIVVVCGIAAFLIEPSVAPGATTWEPLYRDFDRDWKTVHDYRTMRQVAFMVLVNIVLNGLIYFVLLHKGSVHLSLWILFTCICAQLKFSTTALGIWFTILYSVAALFYLYGSSSSNNFIDIRASIRTRRIILGVTTVSILFLLLRLAASGVNHHKLSPNASTFNISPSTKPLASIPVDLTRGHPAAQLIQAAETEFHQTLDRQSKTLGQAVREYRRRNGIAPPPHFDKWFEFAKRRDVVMIDEYDTINQMLLPFWALEPATIRSRIRHAIGHEDSAMIAVAIRNGEVVSIGNGEEWQQQATTGMMKEFVQYLPDMDLGFNIHDEPRVVVPNDLLSAMIFRAQDEIIPRAAKNTAPRNIFSQRPPDMNDGKRFEESSTTKFNRFAHQQTWTHSRLSCPTSSQAQTFEDYAADNLTSYAAGPLNHVYNTSAFSDICNSPSFSSSFGFFERPNAFSIIHELTPVFSQSKISSFQDIIYPSPWYWSGRVGYDRSHDTTWENKTNSLYWRGSTTGGFSRNGGWRRQHRQHVVQRLNAPDNAQILAPTSPAPAHVLRDVSRKSLAHIVDVKFSHIGQCDPGDCDAQAEFFTVTERVDGQDAWYYKHLLDMDGNGFSGRFYAFLKSRSLTYKMSIFREWHSEWLKPWVHYIPLSLRGDEHLDLVAWFSGVSSQDLEQLKHDTTKERQPDKSGNGDTLGEAKAREIALRSTEWHDRVLRNVDLEVWFFRLLLEYGRVVDDQREKIGFAGP